MKALRSRIFLGLLFVMAYQLCKFIMPMRPAGENWDVVYFGGAATFDWIMYRLTPHFVEGKLCRDIEALCIASILVHAIGFALYMAWTSPYFHNWSIRGINYVLAFKLIFTGGGNAFNDIDWGGLVRGDFLRRQNHAAKEAQR